MSFSRFNSQCSADSDNVEPGEGEHRLQYRYTFWFSRKQPGKQLASYNESLKKVQTIASVSESMFEATVCILEIHDNEGLGACEIKKFFYILWRRSLEKFGRYFEMFSMCVSTSSACLLVVFFNLFFWKFLGSDSLRDEELGNVSCELCVSQEI